MPDLLNKLLAQLKAKKVGQKPPALSPDMDDLDMKDSTMPSVAGGAGPSIGMRGPAVKAKDVKKTMRRLVEYMKRYMPLIVTALVMVSAGTVFNLIGPSKPIYIGFGSMGDKNGAEEKTKIILSAMEQTNSRGIIATGFGGLAEIPNLPENIYLLKEAPHAWLFPKCSMVIHHGGAGTTAEGFRAGVPMIIVPHGMDQYAWGKRTFELGVGAEPIKDLTEENLVSAIKFAQSRSVEEKAKQLSDIVKNENGAMKTAEYVMGNLKKVSKKPKDRG